MELGTTVVIAAKGSFGEIDPVEPQLFDDGIGLKEVCIADSFMCLECGNENIDNRDEDFCCGNDGFSGLFGSKG
ncbi:hypothetical protein QR98_0013240 [Sarcoptes scabiei]|uniref:Uncharacterized protein n=1 Tax=Sarcoptes scabiei TaxID=52283 RepID=A0A131ZVN7_SARSC|nr:hypothetical protein QR98_0013240 [Sarcoptes scabiei]